jgi:hypothetical protein
LLLLYALDENGSVRMSKVHEAYNPYGDQPWQAGLEVSWQDPYAAFAARKKFLWLLIPPSETRMHSEFCRMSRRNLYPQSNDILKAWRTFPVQERESPLNGAPQFSASANVPIGRAKQSRHSGRERGQKLCR